RRHGAVRVHQKARKRAGLRGKRLHAANPCQGGRRGHHEGGSEVGKRTRSHRISGNTQCIRCKMKAVTPVGRWALCTLLAASCGDGGSGAPDGSGDAMPCPGNPSQCDDHNPCTTDRADVTPDCRVTCSHDPIPNCCGNHIVEAGEACDDGNVLPFDGCSPQCPFEQALAMNQIGFLPPGSGCDLTVPPDGTPDEAMNNAANSAARDWINNWLTNDLPHEP